MGVCGACAGRECEAVVGPRRQTRAPVNDSWHTPQFGRQTESDRKTIAGRAGCARPKADCLLEHLGPAGRAGPYQLVGLQARCPSPPADVDQRAKALRSLRRKSCTTSSRTFFFLPSPTLQRETAPVSSGWRAESDKKLL